MRCFMKSNIYLSQINFNSNEAEKARADHCQIIEIKFIGYLPF